MTQASSISLHKILNNSTARERVYPSPARALSPVECHTNEWTSSALAAATTSSRSFSHIGPGEGVTVVGFGPGLGWMDEKRVVVKPEEEKKQAV